MCQKKNFLNKDNMSRCSSKLEQLFKRICIDHFEETGNVEEEEKIF